MPGELILLFVLLLAVLAFVWVPLCHATATRLVLRGRHRLSARGTAIASIIASISAWAAIILWFDGSYDGYLTSSPYVIFVLYAWFNTLVLFGGLKRPPHLSALAALLGTALASLPLILFP
jgi:hypothetical protein